MATIEFVTLLIATWNQANQSNRSFEGFVEFIRNQTVACFNGQALYYYEDVMKYLQGKEVVD